MYRLIDIALIVGLLIFFVVYIQIKSQKQEKKNLAYNQDLQKLRKDIFNHFEKNFFL